MTYAIVDVFISIGSYNTKRVIDRTLQSRHYDLHSVVYLRLGRSRLVPLQSV